MLIPARIPQLFTLSPPTGPRAGAPSHRIDRSPARTLSQPPPVHHRGRVVEDNPLPINTVQS